jgi:hypothetical protein
MLSPMSNGGWCVPSYRWIDPYADLTPERLAAERIRLTGGGPCGTCEGTGRLIHKCDCDYCTEETDRECWNCSDGVVDDRTFLLDMTSEERRAYLDPAMAEPIDLPVLSVQRGGISFPAQRP